MALTWVLDFWPRAGIGWNMNYPFNSGDLLCCGACTANYLDASARVPWEDLRYIFGAIMYGGHIVENWDRRLADAYLSKHFNEGLLEGAELFPGFAGPPPGASPVQARQLSPHACAFLIYTLDSASTSPCLKEPSWPPAGPPPGASPVQARGPVPRSLCSPAWDCCSQLADLLSLCPGPFIYWHVCRVHVRPG